MLKSKNWNLIIRNALIVVICLVNLSCAKLKSEIAADVETRVMTRINATVGLINKTDNSTTTNDFWPIVWKDIVFYGIGGSVVVVLGIAFLRRWIISKRIQAEEEIALSHKDCKDVKIPRH